MLNHTKLSDPALYSIIVKEYERQKGNIEMIASESTVPIEVMELNGCVFTNKTLEGYPGNRYQAGSSVADELEILLNQRAKEVFGAEHANLQPYSGSTANYSVYAAILSPGDRIMSMRLDQGGHLTHGSPANFLSANYKYRFYGVHKETEQIDYDALETGAKEFRPKLLIAGGSSYPRLIDYERIAEIAKEVGAYFMVDMAHITGFVAAKLIPSPVPHADFVTSSTTKTFCGPRAGFVLCKAKHAKMLDKGVFPGALGSIHLSTMAAKAWSLQYTQTDEFRLIMQNVLANARILAKALKNHGFRIVSGGTDNHIVMVDVSPKKTTGKQMQTALDYVGITVNKNLIPNDPLSPFVTSGIRIGTTTVSQRGLKEKEIVQIASMINRVAENIENEKILNEIKREATTLIGRFPLYKDESYFY